MKKLLCLFILMTVSIAGYTQKNSKNLITKKDTISITDSLKPNLEISQLNIVDDTLPGHNMPVLVPQEYGIPYMPVYDPGPDYHGFLLIAGSKKINKNRIRIEKGVRINNLLKDSSKLKK